MIDKTLAHYRITDKIGEGGVGVEIRREPVLQISDPARLFDGDWNDRVFPGQGFDVSPYSIQIGGWLTEMPITLVTTR